MRALDASSGVRRQRAEQPMTAPAGTASSPAWSQWAPNLRTTSPHKRDHAEPYEASTHHPDVGWQYHAECRFFGPDTFFSGEGESNGDRARRETRARRICLSCKVIKECRTDAEGNGEHYGVWGGTTERERARLRSRSRQEG